MAERPGDMNDEERGAVDDDEVTDLGDEDDDVDDDEDDDEVDEDEDEDEDEAEAEEA